MPSVVIIGPAHPLRGGLASFDERLAREFQRSGWNTTIFTFSLQYPGILFPGASQYSEAAKPEDLKIKVCINSINPFNWIRIGLQLKKTAPDIIIARYWIPFMGPCLGTILRLAKSNKKSKIICLVDNIIPHEKRIGDEIFTRYFMKSPDAYIVMGESVKQSLLKLKPNAKFTLTDHPLFDTFGEPVDKNEARHFLKIPPDKKLLLFFGFIRKYKGLDLLLDALSSELLQGSDIHLLVAGEFYEDSKPYLELIEKYQLKKYVHLHTHFIPNDEVKYYLSSADVVVQPYRSATQSGVTPLAYHFEKPMIVTDVGSLAELVPHDQVGLVCQPEANSIAFAIKSFFQKEPGHFLKGIREGKSKLSWKTFVDKILNLSNEIQK